MGNYRHCNYLSGYYPNSPNAMVCVKMGSLLAEIEPAWILLIVLSVVILIGVIRRDEDD